MTEQQHRIIEDYLNMVRKHLDPKTREDVIEELRGYIMDAALDNETGELSDDRVWKILAQFGAPSEVADQYTGKERVEPEQLRKSDSQILLLPKLQYDITGIMIIATFFAPYLYMGNMSGGGLFSLLMTWDLGNSISLSSSNPLIGFAFGFPNFLLFIQFIRYQLNKTSMHNLLVMGVLSFTIPVILIWWMLFVPGAVVIPIPLQVITMLIILIGEGRIIYGEDAKALQP